MGARLVGRLIIPSKSSSPKYSIEILKKELVFNLTVEPAIPVLIFCLFKTNNSSQFHDF